MTPDPSFTTTGREGENSARIINGMEKKLIRFENSFSDKLHQQVITSVQWGYSDSRLPCDKPKQGLIALICCGQCMAVSIPGHGDFTVLMFRIAFSLTLWVPTVWIHPEVERFVRIAVAWRMFALRE